MLGGAVTALHTAPQQAVPPHLLIVGNQRVSDAPEVGGRDCRSKSSSKTTSPASKRCGCSIRYLPTMATFVANRDRAVRALLQEQLRVADAAARDHDVLRRIKVQLLRGA